MFGKQRAHSAEQEFYLRCSKMVLLMAHGFASGERAIEPKDICQDVMVNILKFRLFEKIEGKTEDFFLEGYLFRVVKNRFLEIERNRKTIDFQLVASENQAPENWETVSRELQLFVTEFMQQHPAHREKVEVFLKIHLEGKSHVEVAEEYRINLNLLYQWLFRARLQLTTFFQQKGITPGHFFDLKND
jgi:RNA polymerase sigma factor (sigma-70 family)